MARRPPATGGLAIRLVTSPEPLLDGMSRDLQVHVREHPNLLGGHILYAEDRLDSRRVSWFPQAFPLVLERLVEAPDAPLSDLAPEIVLAPSALRI